MGIQLLASDLDGTLLQNGAKKPSNEAIELIQELQKKGIVFCAASGRQYHSLRKLFGPIANEIAYICENGCLTIHQDEILYQAKFPDGKPEEIYHAVEEYPEYGIIMSGAYYTYAHKKNKKLIDLLKNYYNYAVKEFEYFSDIPEQIIKISLHRETKLGGKEVEFFEKSFGDVATIVTSGMLWMDFTPKNVTKKTGIEKLAEHLQIPLSDCMAVGDEFNDYTMLETVGHPVAMENARPGILELCKTHTKTVEELIRGLL